MNMITESSARYRAITSRHNITSVAMSQEGPAEVMAKVKEGDHIRVSFQSQGTDASGTVSFAKGTLAEHREAGAIDSPLSVILEDVEQEAGKFNISTGSQTIDEIESIQLVEQADMIEEENERKVVGLGVVAHALSGSKPLGKVEQIVIQS